MIATVSSYLTNNCSVDTLIQENNTKWCQYYNVFIVLFIFTAMTCDDPCGQKLTLHACKWWWWWCCCCCCCCCFCMTYTSLTFQWDWYTFRVLLFVQALWKWGYECRVKEGKKEWRENSFAKNIYKSKYFNNLIIR